MVVPRCAGAPDAVDTHYLRRRFNLSPVESEILPRLRCGKRIEVIAEARSVTLNTVRSYLMSLFRKTGCHSQAEVVATGWRCAVMVHRGTLCRPSHINGVPLKDFDADASRMDFPRCGGHSGAMIRA